MKFTICIIGAGNLATHLSTELKKSGHEVLQVYSRTEDSAKKLATRLDAEFTISTEDVTKAADIYFIALKDSVIDEVLSKINFQNKLVVHCSGSLPLSVLNTYSENIGVFYPLQTFSKNRNVDFSDIPVFIESNSEKNETVLQEIASNISANVSVLNSEKRKSLHIAAVFACNFVNHFYALAGNFLATKDIPFQVLRPLIQETAQKAMEMNPTEAQTGPAVRYDENIINDHLNELKEFNGLGELYNSISKSIFELHQKK
jgi:predicted short-subunit dehydrogenase-like oxidoreductase (DUF2520 family)